MLGPDCNKRFARIPQRAKSFFQNDCHVHQSCGNFTGVSLSCGIVEFHQEFTRLPMFYWSWNVAKGQLISKETFFPFM
jgi:hypothetical protein